MGPSSGSYGDASSIGRKNVYSMDNASSSDSTSNTDFSTSDSSLSEYSGEESDSQLSRIQNINNKIRGLENRTRELEIRIQRLHFLTSCLNDSELRVIADKVDNNVQLTTEER